MRLPEGTGARVGERHPYGHDAESAALIAEGWPSYVPVTVTLDHRLEASMYRRAAAAIREDLRWWRGPHGHAKGAMDAVRWLERLACAAERRE